MWFAISCSATPIICWTWQYCSAARLTFCLFVVTWREIFSSSTEMQHLLKVYLAMSFIFLTLLIYLLALNWPDAPWKYLLDSSLLLQVIPHLSGFWRWAFSSKGVGFVPRFFLWMAQWWLCSHPGLFSLPVCSVAAVSRITATSYHHQSCFSSCDGHELE